MSASNNSLDQVKRDVLAMHLFDNDAVMGSYNPLFYNHLLLLLKPKLLVDNRVDEMVLNFRSYIGLEQYTMDNSASIEAREPNDIDWNFVDEAKGIFVEAVQNSLKKENRSEHFKPLIKFSGDQFENYHIYDQQFPDSVYNPWTPVHDMFRNGFMIMLSDNRDLLDHYNKGIFKISDDVTKLGVVAKSGKNNRVNGFMVDKRHSAISMVFEYLKKEAPGSDFAKSIPTIQRFLQEQGKRYNYQQIRGRILLPLKRAGLAGSSSNGFYYLTTKEDFLATYHSHLEKVHGIQRTIKMYEDRYRNLEYGDLKSDYENW